MIQQTSWLALDLNIIVDLAPREDVLLCGNDVDVCLIVVLLVGLGDFLISSAKLFVVAFALCHVLHILGNMSASEDQHFCA